MARMATAQRAARRPQQHWKSCRAARFALGFWSAALLLSSYGDAQTNSSDPTFTFTPAHGNKITQGRFSPGGSISFIDQFDGTASSLEISKIERIVMTPRKAPCDSKCGASPEVIVTFVDGSRERGCFTPGAPLAFIGSAAITSVNNTTGKFIREKR